MNRPISMAALGAAILLSHPVLAQVTGGDVEIKHSFFTDDSDFAKSAINGSVALGFGPAFGVQADASAFSANFADDNGTSAALHGIYNLNDRTALGAFYGLDRFAGDSSEFWGLEVGQQIQSFDVEGYIGRAEDQSDQGTMLGLAGSFGINDTLEVGASVDRVEIGGDSLTRLGLNGDYAVGSNTAITGEVGSIKQDGDDSDVFVGLGIKFNFGPEGEATFGRRGYQRLLPGL